MGISPADLLSQIFGGKKEEPKQEQPKPVAASGFNFSPTLNTPAPQSTPQPSQFDFSKFVEQPSSDSYMEPEVEEDEVLDDYVDTEGQPKNTFVLNLPGLTPTTTNKPSPFSLDNVIKSPAASGYVSPYEGKRGKHPNNCDCSIHRGTGQTPENIANAFPSTLQTQEGQKSSFGFNTSPPVQTQPQGNEININVNKQTLFLIGEGLETIGRAIKSLAENS